jgi:hypothetical protein
MPILAILHTGDGYSHSIHKTKEIGTQSTKGTNYRHKGWYLGCKVTILQVNGVGS